MPTPGQPYLYNPTYCELARDYCLVGATNEVLGDYFGVTRRTIQNWIAAHPDFADAVRKGRVAVHRAAEDSGLIDGRDNPLTGIRAGRYRAKGLPAWSTY